MELQKLLDMQRKLDQHIEDEKGLEGQELFPDKVVALLCEVNEFGNEARFFKFWSEDREPRKSSIRSVKYNELIHKPEPYNPLLEEWIDGFHFFLSIALEKGWEELLYIHEEAIEEVRKDGFDGGLTSAFIEMQYWITVIYTEKDKEYFIKGLEFSKHEFAFRSAWFLFLGFGLAIYDFTFEQIYEAYVEKNKINHERQTSGY